MEYRETYESWLSNPYFDEETKDELRAIADDDKEIKERFYKDLEFGTAGLRGVIGAGTNRMNIYVVRKTTQGLANYIAAVNAQEKGVAIAYDSRRMSPEFAKEAALLVWQPMAFGHIFLRACVLHQSFLMLFASWDVLQVSILLRAIIRRSITVIRYTGRTERRSHRLMTAVSWLKFRK